MPISEIYIKLSVTFADDPKVRALARYGIDGILARDLYVQMILHCKRLLTDGFVPDEQIGLLAYPVPLDHANQLAKQLASVGLIKEVSNLEAQGWQVCAYLKRNGTKQDVEELSKVRAEAGRAGGTKSRKRPGQHTSKTTGKQVANKNAQQTSSNAVSVSVRPNGLTDDRDVQTPTVSAGEPAGELSETQRSKRLTDAYAEAEPLCKWPAVNGVVLKAIRSRRFTDDEIRAALLRLAAENRSVTVDSLRTELQGFSPNPQRPAGAPRPSTTDQRVADAQALKASLRSQEPR
jgi:hypothetical protein